MTESDTASSCIAPDTSHCMKNGQSVITITLFQSLDDFAPCLGASLRRKALLRPLNLIDLPSLRVPTASSSLVAEFISPQKCTLLVL